MSIIINDPKNQNIYYIASQHIKAYPCGSRTYFDPESRLNTEYNIRRNSALNGFKNSYVQTFLLKKGTDDIDLIDINFFVNGYYFEITDLPIEDLNTISGSEPDSSYIYAKISLADRKLYSLTMALLPDINIKENIYDENVTIPYNTAVLANQAVVKTPKLDIISFASETATDLLDTYFFAGLSLSSNKEDIAQSENEGILLSHFYLPILQRNEGTWEVPQTSFLPRIDHGKTVDSIRVFGDIEAEGNTDFKGESNTKEFSATEFDKITLSGNEINLKGNVNFLGENAKIELKGDVTINGCIPTHCCLQQIDDTNIYRLTFVPLTAGNKHQCLTNTETDETQ